MAALATLLIVGACNDSAGPDDDDALTQAEVEALLHGIHDLETPSFDSQDGRGEATVQCPLGGQVTVSGTWTPQGSATEWILRLQACRFTARGTTFTITSAPNLRYSGHVYRTTTTGGHDYDVTGAVDWETGSPARQGRCSMDLNLVNYHLWGTACGLAVDLELD